MTYPHWISRKNLENVLNCGEMLHKSVRNRRLTLEPTTHK